MNGSISLFKLRYLVREVLLLTPFMPAIEKLLVYEIAEYNMKKEKLLGGESPSSKLRASGLGNASKFRIAT